MSLIVEIAQAGGGWRRLGELHDGEPPGSMSHNPQGEQAAAREIVIFSCRGDHSLIQRSLAGADSERAGGLVRTLATLGTETIARLRAGQQIELMIRTDSSRAASRIRFRHEEGP